MNLAPNSDPEFRIPAPPSPGFPPAGIASAEERGRGRTSGRSQGPPVAVAGRIGQRSAVEEGFVKGLPGRGQRRRPPPAMETSLCCRRGQLSAGPPGSNPQLQILYPSFDFWPGSFRRRRRPGEVINPQGMAGVAPRREKEEKEEKAEGEGRRRVGGNERRHGRHLPSVRALRQVLLAIADGGVRAGQQLLRGQAGAQPGRWVLRHPGLRRLLRLLHFVPGERRAPPPFLTFQPPPHSILSCLVRE